MDPLSVTASAVAIIQLTTALIKGTRRYYKSLKDAPKEIASFIEQLESLGAVLERLKHTSEEADAIPTSQPTTNGGIQNAPSSNRLPLVKRMLQVDGPLAICFEEMLAFRAKLCQDKPSKIKRSLKWPFEKDDIRNAVTRLKELKSVLDTAILNDHLALTVEIREGVERLKNQSHTAAIKALSGTISDWLSAPDPSTNLATARNKRQQDTGNWLLESPKFSSWKTEPCSLLWLHGKPGAGKTILSSTAIHSLLEKDRDHSNIIYFYFDFQSREKQSVHGLLSSMAVQLNCDEAMFRILEEFYNSHAHGKIRPTLQDLKDLVRRMIDGTKLAYLVIDALDECEERRQLLDSLDDMRSWNQDKLHVFVTSRREPDIESSLVTTATHTIPLEDSVVQEDILSFVSFELLHDTRLAKWPERVRQEIQSTLLAGANGMFRWVELQLNAIRGCLKIGPLRRTLKSLPKTLDDTYTRILNSISEDYAEDARRILSCLTCSFHPLAIEEIADIVAIVLEGETTYDDDNRLSQPRDILSICSGLVTTTKLTRLTYMGWQHHAVEVLRFAHFSVKEYLVSERPLSTTDSIFGFDECQAHKTLASLCMNYLERCHKDNVCEDPQFLWEHVVLRSERFPFGQYAASHWSRHLRAAQVDSSSPLLQQGLRILTDPAFLRDVIRLHTPWFRHRELNIMRSCGYVDRFHRGDQIVPTVGSVPPVYYASLSGLDQLVIMLLEKGEDVNSDCAHGTCLTAAVCGGHQSTVRLLLERGADINARVLLTSGELQGSYSRTAIHEAVWAFLYEQIPEEAPGWSEEMVKLLLSWGADVNLDVSCPQVMGEDRSTGSRPWVDPNEANPLNTAIRRRNKNIIRLLIDAGANRGKYTDRELQEG